MTSKVASPANTSESAPPAVGDGAVRSASPFQRWWGLIVVLTAVVSLVAGAAVEHVVAQRQEARDLYRIQISTTAIQYLDQEQHQLSLPVAKRSAIAFGNLADSITANTGLNGSGTLQVSQGTGSVKPFTQIAFTVTVSSPYASTTFVTWALRGAGSGGMSSSNQGACMLSSSLLGNGLTRATTDLNLGSSEFMPPCTRQLWWSRSKPPLQPHLGWAGISMTAQG